MSAEQGRRLIPVSVHGAKMSGAPRPVKDLNYNELDYYQEGRNEPVPPDANIVSAVKLKKKSVLMNVTVNKTEEERKLTEMRVDACLRKMKSKNRSIPIPACDPLIAMVSNLKVSNTEEVGPEPGNASDEIEIEASTELKIFMDEFQGKAFDQLPTIKFTCAVNDQHFAIKTQDGPLKSELRKVKSEMKEFYSDSQNADLQNGMTLKLGGFYVYRAVMQIGELKKESFIRVQVTVLRDDADVRVFLCDEGYEMDIDDRNDLFPMLKKWTDLPQLACWAQIAPGSTYLKEGVDEHFQKLHEGQSFKILQIGKEAVFKYSDSLCPVKVISSRLRIIKNTGDFQRYIREA